MERDEAMHAAINAEGDPMRNYLEQRERDLVARVAALSEALSEAVEEWASALNVMPNMRSRKRLDEARAILERDGL